MRYSLTRCTLNSPKLLGLIAASAFLFSIPLVTLASAPAQQATKSDSQSPPSGDYVGMDTCITCHADQGQHFQNTIMGHAFSHPRTDLEKLGCEACHGPGKAHVEAGGGKDT